MMDGYYVQTSDTPLALACEKRDYDAVVKEINAGGNVNQGNLLGQTPLHWAVRYAYEDEQSAIKIVNLLLDEGAEINAQTVFEGETALMWAAYYGALEVAKVLLARGADVNAQRTDGGTVLSSLEAAPSLVARRKRFIKLFEKAGGTR